MSINPIELLKQKVSSVIVNDQTCLVNEKNAILSRFYPILLSRFLANPELIDQLKEKLRPCLSDLLENNNQVINSLLIHLAAGKLSVTDVETTLNRAIPKSLAVLSAEVGHEAIYIIHYLREHSVSIQALLPVWSAEVLLPLNQLKLNEPEQSEEPLPEMPPEPHRHHRIFPFFALFVASFSLIWLYQLVR